MSFNTILPPARAVPRFFFVKLVRLSILPHALLYERERCAKLRSKQGTRQGGDVIAVEQHDACFAEVETLIRTI